MEIPSFKYLRNYAEWYYTKYFPSRRALIDKLRRKTEDTEMIEKVLQNIESLIVEKQNIESRVHQYIQAGKPVRTIRQKLLQKKFQKDDISLALEDRRDETENPNTYRLPIERVIAKGILKGSSKNGLKYELTMQYPDAKDLILELLAEYDDTSVLEKIIPPLLERYTEEKVFAKLMQKGFRSSDIYAFLRRLM